MPAADNSSKNPPQEILAPADPDTPALLVFLDFVYVVVLGDFIHHFFEKILFDKQSNQILSLDLHHFWVFLFCVGIFVFVTYDWLHARSLTLIFHYKNYGRFFLDLGIAFLSYGALMRAVDAVDGAEKGHGPAVAGFYVILILAAASVWALYVLVREKPPRPLRGLFARIAFSHTLCAILLFFVLVNPNPPEATWQPVIFALVFIETLFIIDDAVLVMLVEDKALWRGPHAPLVPRSCWVWLFERAKSQPGCGSQ